MALKKSDLYSSLWASCDALRGGMDASQYKDYVLSLLFIKYVSDKYAGQDYAPITIPKGADFNAMIALKNKTDIGDQINKKIIAPLIKANKQLSQSDFPDFNDTKLGDGKEKTDRLTDLVAIFQNPVLDFSKNRAEGDDILGDAYEYLMRHFATESGKSKGQFYTPAEVSRIMAQIIGIRQANASRKTTVYDPTCGSGSLLLKVGDEAGAKVSLYGQEKDNATSGLARMNMILHDNPTAEIAEGNTLVTPKFKDGASIKQFDFIVANPPFSDKKWSTGLDPLKDPHDRFKSFGIPPAKQGDYAYLLHIIRSLKSTGTGACILPHGVLFRGNAEGEIRKNLVKKGYIKGIIGLPANLFYGTGIPACIVVVDKKDATARKGIFMVDASQGFTKDGPKNRLRAQDLHEIVDTFTKMDDVQGYARMVSFAEIEKNDYNLNLPRYIDSQKAEDRQDIEGHLRGGIPQADIDALKAYWEICPKLKATLFRECRKGYVDLTVDKAAIKSTIFEHPEFVTFTTSMAKHFNTWRNKNAEGLKGIKKGIHPKKVIFDLSESLLAHYTGKPLMDKYAVYQHLMDYWVETMQDDCYAIALDGWKAEPYRIIEKDKKGKEKDKGWACDLIPKSLIVARFFAKEQAEIDQMNADLEAKVASLDELVEEHSGEDGVFADFDKVNQAAVISRLKEINNDKSAKEETLILLAYMTQFSNAKNLAKKLKEAEEELDMKALAKYPKLTVDEIKALVVDDKWMGKINTDIHGEMDRINQSLTQRVNTLAERYEMKMPDLAKRVAKLETKVEKHLKVMGFGAIKQGPMQEILRPKKNWIECRLGDTAQLKARIGWQGLTTAEYLDSGDYHLVTGTEFKDGFVDWDNCHFVDRHRYDQDKYIQLRENDVLVTKDGTIGKVAFVDILPRPATLNSGVFVIRPFNGTFKPKFLYYILMSQLFEDFLAKLSAGSTISHLYQKDFVNFSFFVPPTEEEQNEISTILMDMDQEIRGLETKLSKARQIKQGMVQDLLTDQVRLI